jgi:hypothetical protein
MNLATLRVEGTDSDFEALIKELSLESDAHWNKGEKRRNGSVHALSGFNATVADAKNPRELIDLIRAFLMLCKNK